MPRQELALGRSPKFLIQKIGWSVAFAAAAVYKWRDGSLTYTILWGLMSVVFAAYAVIMRTTPCPTPGCGEVFELDKGIAGFTRCKKCGAYVEVEKGKIWTVAEDRVAATPAFSVSIGGPDDPVLNPLGVSSVAKSPTLDGGTRELAFRWPEGCCVCGKKATGTQGDTLGAVGKFARALGFADERLSFSVAGIPHCAEHGKGAALDIQDLKLVLKFRSNPYRNAFRKVNGLS